MAINLGDAILFFKGDTAGLDSASQRVGDITNKVGMGMTAFGATVTGAIGLAVKGFSDYAESVDTAAKKTGFSTDAIQEWKYAAEQSSASLEDVANSVRFMGINLDMAVTQGGAAGDAIAALGLDAQQLAAMQPEQAFEKILLAVAAVPDEMKKTAIAQDIFGRGASALRPLMAEGADGIAALRNEAHSLGLVMDGEAITAGEAFGDEMAKLKAGLLPIAADIAKVMMPVIVDLAEMLREGAQWVASFTKEHPAFTKFMIEGAAVVGGLAAVLGPMLLMVQPMIGLFGGIGAAVGGVTSVIGAATSAFSGLSLAGAALAAAPWVLGIGAIAAGIAAIAGSALSTMAAYDQLAEAQARLDATTQQYIQSLREKGIVIDENRLKEMDEAQQRAYLADMEKMQGDALLRAHLEHYLGRTETEQEYAQARNLMLSEHLTAEEAAKVASMGLGADRLREIMQMDRDETEVFLNSVGLRKAGALDGDSALTQSALDAARVRQEAYIDSTNKIVTNEGEATSMIGRMWSNLWEEVKSWFGFGGPAPAVAGYAAGGTVAGTGDQVAIIAGEEGPEAGILPDGDVAMLGLLGPGLFAVPPGTEIKTADETEAEYGGAFAQGGLVLSAKQKKALKKARKSMSLMLQKALTAGLIAPEEANAAMTDVSWGARPITELLKRDGEITGERGTALLRGGPLEWELIAGQKGGFLKSSAGELNLSNVPRFAAGGVVPAAGAGGGVQNNAFKIEIRDVTIREEADIDRISQAIARDIQIALAGTA